MNKRTAIGIITLLSLCLAGALMYIFFADPIVQSLNIESEEKALQNDEKETNKEEDPWEKLKEDPVLKSYKQEILEQFSSQKSLLAIKEKLRIRQTDERTKNKIFKELDKRALSLRALTEQEKEALLNRKKVDYRLNIYQFGEYYIGLCLISNPHYPSFCIQDQENPYFETEESTSKQKFSGVLIKKRGEKLWYPLMDTKLEKVNPIAFWIERGEVFLAVYIGQGGGSGERVQAIYRLMIKDEEEELEKSGRRYYGCYYGGGYNRSLGSAKFLDILQKYFSEDELEREIWAEPEDLIILEEMDKKYCNPSILRHGKEGEDPQREEQILPERYSFELG